MNIQYIDILFRVEQGGIDFVDEIYAKAETYFVAELNYRKYLIYF